MTNRILLVTLFTIAVNGCGNYLTGFPCDPEPSQNASDCNFKQGTAESTAISIVKAYPELDFTAAVYFASVPDEERQVVVEQTGLIKVFEDQDSASATKTVLDISSTILYAGEQGLLGLAFDPAFNRNRLVYLYYSMGKPRRSVVSSMVWNKNTDRLDLASEKIILEIRQPYSNHNGGMLDFGPDDFLYIAVGDGGSGGDPQNHGQNLQTLLGSILRIDVHPADPGKPYGIPDDNPFIKTPDARAEVFAYGLRNPFRFSFDRKTGDLWAGDVGQGKLEEINIVRSGGNYGWRVYEGKAEYDPPDSPLPASTYTKPVTEYDHSQGSSVIGGYVYRGEQLPTLAGHYLYADFVSGTVWALKGNSNSVSSNFAVGAVKKPSSFGQDNNGELILVSYSDGLFRFAENR